MIWARVEVGQLEDVDDGEGVEGHRSVQRAVQFVFFRDGGVFRDQTVVVRV